ncbi:MAG TPA: peptidase [Bacteroidia bacterium]|nr:peptidase [Bacteroidia bacterium]
MRNVNTFILLLFTLLAAPVADGCRKDYRDNLLKIKPEHFLSDDKYNRLDVELVFVQGYGPTQQTVAHITNFLTARLNKPSGINITSREISPTGRGSVSSEDLRDLEKQHRTKFTKGKTLAAFFFFVDAPFSGNSGNEKTLGVAYGTTSMAVFSQTVYEYSGGFGQPSRFTLETAVAEHEIGHLLGLVDNGTDMKTFHRDESHGKHCTEQNCLMYYQVETNNILLNILQNNIPELDQNCLNDLKANGGK